MSHPESRPMKSTTSPQQIEKLYNKSTTNPRQIHNKSNKWSLGITTHATKLPQALSQRNCKHVRTCWHSTNTNCSFSLL